MRQAGVHAPGPVGLTDHFADRQTEGLGQTLTAVVDVMGQARPAACHVLLVSFLETGRRLHARLAPSAAFDVADAIQRSEYLLTELRALVENRVDHVRGGVFTSRKALIVRFVAEQLVTYETDIAQGGLVVGHSVNLSGEFL